MKDQLIVLIGPTAVGKTKLSIELAKALNGEIISGDSMQVYRGMDIGTAKVTKEEMEGVKHYLIDICEPTDSYTVADFQESVFKYIKIINKKGKIPILVGGTGLYIQSIIHNYNFSDESSDESFRYEMEKLVEEGRANELFEQLYEIDPTSANKIHPNNTRRVIRALEIYHTTGKIPSEVQISNVEALPFEYVLIGLTMERKKLYERINQRVDIMMEQGLLAEVKALFDRGIRDCQSIQGIGYKEIYSYLKGAVTLDEAIENLKQNSRRFAKRQFTWFHNKMDVKWFDVTNGIDDILQKEILNYIAGKFKKL